MHSSECRTCVKPIATNTKSYSLREAILVSDNCVKTYGELLNDLLKSGLIELGSLMPQILCSKCAHFLQDVYHFVLEANKLSEVYRQRVCTIKSEDCLDELPIDMPSGLASYQLEHIKIEPETFFDETSIVTKNIISTIPLEKNIVTNKELRHIKFDDEIDGFYNNSRDLYEENLHSQSSSDNDNNDNDASAQSVKLEQKSWAVRCDVCNKIYRNAVALTTHKRYTHMPDEKKIRCSLCNYRTPRVSNLKTHLRAIHGGDSIANYIKVKPKPDGNFSCNQCLYRCQRKCDLKSHIKRKHNTNTNNKNIISGHNSLSLITTNNKFVKPKIEDSLLCPDCGQTFKTKKGLDMHIRKHTGERPYKCDLCEKTFMRQQSMKSHRVIHSDEKPHKCTICNKAFKRMDKLTVHMRVHSELRPYKCSECGKAFKYAYVLRTHMHIHTGEKPFSCKNCDKQFSFRTSLNLHSGRCKISKM